MPADSIRILFQLRYTSTKDLCYFCVKFEGMIQRIQTVYLLVAITALITLTLGVDVFSYELAKANSAELAFHANSYGIQIEGTLNENSTPEDKKALANVLNIEGEANQTLTSNFSSFPFYSVTLFVTMIAIASLLTFKKLPTQLRLGRMAFFFNLLILLVTIVFYYTLRSQFNEVLENAEINAYLGVGFFCLIFSTAFLFLANIGIKRDLNLIKSIDRIR